ncbi:MAG: hypothetical protein WD228_08200 [Mycobacterium sp.]
MLQTFRAPLTAGAVAAFAAAALITAPADNSGRLLAALGAPSNAQVTLSAWQNPIVALLDSGELAENYVFGSYYDGGGVPTPGAGEANWPYAGFDQTGGDLLNYLLYNTPGLGDYFYVGFLENFIRAAYFPAVLQLQLNVGDYVSVVLSGLNLAARQLAVGVWDLPAAALGAVQLAVTGQFSEALTVISDAIISPIVAAGQSVLDVGNYVLSNVAARASAVIAALPQILTTFAGSVIGGVPIVAQQAIAIVTGVVSSLSTLNFEGTWNTAVDGLLGPSGIQGTLLNLITGAGIQTGPIVDPETDIPTNFVPSFRTAAQAAQWTLKGALEKPATAVSSASAARSAARVANPTPTPAAALIGDAATAAADSPPPAEAPAEAEAEAENTARTASTAAQADASDHRAIKRDRIRRGSANRAGN